MRFPLTGFADEISPDLDVQLDTMVRLGIQGLDLRNAYGKNVIELTDDELRSVGAAASARGLYVACIGSPVNKVAYTPENRPLENEKLARAINAARITGCKRIRLFTPETSEDRHQADAAGIIDWMREQVEMAQAAECLLLHENDARFWAAYPQNAELLFKELGGPHLMAAFDFANTVLIGFRPRPDWFPWLLPHLHTLHIKDAVESEHKVVPAGEGNGDLEETLRWLIGMGWHGPLTLEPHLQAAGQYGGFSGPDLFGVATEALKAVLTRAGGES